MAKPLLPDELWEIIRPILPVHTPDPRGGRPRLDDRKALTGILFILKTGIPWEDLPCELGCGSGMTCWRRLRQWHQAGVWERIKAVLHAECPEAHRINWARAARDSRLKGAEVAAGWQRTDPPHRSHADDHLPATKAPALESVGHSSGAQFGEDGLKAPLQRRPPVALIHCWADSGSANPAAVVRATHEPQECHITEPVLV